MARPLTGKLRIKVLADGRQAFYARVRGTERLIGTEPAWTETKAGQELRERIVPMAKLGQPWWDRYGASGPSPAAAEVPTLHAVASDYLAIVERRSTNKSTRNAASSPVLKHILPFMAYYDAKRTRPRPMTDVTPILVDQFIAEKVREREVLGALPDTLAELDDATLRDEEALARELDEEEFRLLCAYGQRSNKGKRSLSSRGLSDNEINRCLDRLRDIVRLANRNYRLGLDDPTEDKGQSSTDPPDDWLRPDQMQAILDAADELDAAATRYKPNRGALVRVLAFAGPRVSELGGMRIEHVSMDERVIRIPEAKTSAGKRDLHMHRVVARAVKSAAKGRQSGWLFPTDKDTRRDRHNVRVRVLAPVLVRAAELLQERGQRPLPGTVMADGTREPGRVTPHTFRRTYLTYCAWAGKPPRFAMAQAGHRDAKLTLTTYQKSFPAKLDDRVKKWLAD